MRCSMKLMWLHKYLLGMFNQIKIDKKIIVAVFVVYLYLPNEDNDMTEIPPL